MNSFIFLCLIFTGQIFAANDNNLLTIAEKSHWIKTGNAEEVKRLCLTFQKSYPQIVKCRIYGKTPENRDLYYMTIGDPKTAAVWVQAGIHAGEIDGKDAGFLLIKEILTNQVKNPLQDIHLVFVPVVNLDGHERIGKWNRPNQVGPEEMGWRTTAQNINMNRDFMKVDAPEMKDLITLWHKVDPILSLDLHATNGAQFQVEVGLIVLPNIYQSDEALNVAGKDFETALLVKMKEQNHLAVPFYPSFLVDNEPLSGFAQDVALARFAHGYWYNNNRLGMLVETHSWKDYATRVKTHRATVLASLEIAQNNFLKWRKIQKEYDLMNLSGKKVNLSYDHTKKSTPIKFPGYKFTKQKSTISGGQVIKYFPDTLMEWEVPLYNELEAKFSVEAPLSGYFVQPSDTQWILPKLKAHGIKFETWKNANPKELKIFRATKTEFAAKSYEGHQTLKLEGEWKQENISLPKGMIFIPINQAKARMILHLFEPQADDSFAAWGFFNRAFERKEYMENYVTEDVAKTMLEDAEIKKEFESKLKTDTEFAQSPDKRFEFFYRKHPSWDDRFNRYPVFKQ